MPHIRSATSEQTWAAEWTANRASTEQDIERTPHACGRCRNPWTGRSALKCPNEVGGL